MTEKNAHSVYADLEPEYCDPLTAQIYLLPLPYDDTSTWQKGAERGPQAIIEASRHMELYDIETDTEVYRRGIFTVPAPELPTTPENAVQSIRTAARKVLAHERFLVGIGGEHSVTIGLVQAFAEKYPRLSVLQLDAHSDLRNSYDGIRYSHACVMARVRELCPIVQIGIRSMDSSEKENLDTSRILYAHQLHKDCRDVDEIIAKLDQDVYLTIDLDVLDPAYMPSTGTPEPGGLDWYQVNRIIQKVAEKHNIVGMDVTELLPNPQNPAPDFLAAKLIYRSLSVIMKERNNEKN